MKTSSQLLLTFLLNACWQIALVTALAYLSDRLLRNSPARYRHLVWVSALILAIGIPITTSSQLLIDTLKKGHAAYIPPVQQGIERFASFEEGATQQAISFARNEAWLLNPWFAYVLIALYLAVLLFCAMRLLHAWRLTRRILHTANDISSNKALSEVFEACASAVGKSQAKICLSHSVHVPVTIGLFRPVIILPDELTSEENYEVLTSAIGHELIHVRRRDYALNLVYELLFLPIAFHPGASLIRRRIRQTRELSCDELVAERILNPEAYARSLLKLASSAPTLGRLSVTTTVGIADADILEARIMSLLKKSKLDSRRKRMLLIAASVLLLVPCLAAGSFAMKFDLQPSETVVQDPATQEKESRERQTTEQQMKMRTAMPTDPKAREEIMRKMEVEMEMRAVKQAALFRLARINMDQAIQIATSQTPGKVMSCTLDANKWEKPGELAKDGKIFYRVTIVTSEDPNSGMTHVLVNAIDGQIIATRTELPRKQQQ